jgi:hypothetical protein
VAAESSSLSPSADRVKASGEELPHTSLVLVNTMIHVRRLIPLAGATSSPKRKEPSP